VFSALVRKEWRQLAALRWVGLAIGILLPPLLLASAEVARQGWLPSQRISGYSVETLFLEIQPAFLLVAAALISLLVSCQCFSGDRAAGTETFLLERPVGRPSIWRARLLATLATTTAVVIGHVAVWWLFARSSAAAAGPSWDQALRLLGIGLPLVVVVAVVAGLAAASVLDSPMQAVMLAIVLGIVPVALAALLTGLFPYAAVRGVSFGPLASLVLLAGYLVASFRMLCRGEPAGRGRLLRGAVVLGIALLAAPLSFMVAAPLALRLEAGRWVDGPSMLPAPSGSLAVAHNERSGSAWLIDTANGRRLRFFPPPTFGYQWNADGSRLVVVHAAGALGGYSAVARADFYDGAGRPIGRIALDPQAHFLGQVHWAGDRLAVRVGWSQGRTSLWIVTPESGEVRTIDFDLGYQAWRLLASQADGGLYVLRARSSDWPEDRGVVLQRVDAERGELDPRPVLEDEADGEGLESFAWFYRFQLSPTGRYLQRAARRWLDLRTMEEHAIEGRGWTGWLADDALAWLDRSADGRSRLYLGAPDGSRELLRSWESGTVTVEVSPDRERMLVRVYTDAAGGTEHRVEGAVPLAPEARMREVWIFDRATGRWTDASGWVDRTLAVAEQQIAWAGVRTLALGGPGWLGLRDLDADATVRYLAGSPPGR